MMIFSLTLTANQIRVLRSLEASIDRNDHEPMRDISNFIGGSKMLLREGLISHHNKPHPHYLITEKGRLVLKLVEADIKDFVREIESAPEVAPAPKKKARVA